MPKVGPKRTRDYGEEFKATVAQLSGLPRVLFKDLAAPLGILRSC